jgi:hypothetical protein
MVNVYVWCMSRSLLLSAWPWGVFDGRTGGFGYGSFFVCLPEWYNCNYFDERAITIHFSIQQHMHTFLYPFFRFINI